MDDWEKKEALKEIREELRLKRLLKELKERELWWLLTACSRRFGVTWKETVSKKSTAAVVLARTLMWRELREKYAMSSEQVGLLWGCNPSVVHYARRRENRLPKGAFVREGVWDSRAERPAYPSPGSFPEGDGTGGVHPDPQ
jgi:hypothetical protein